MTIGDEVKEMIISEIEFVVERMEAATAPSEKLYYFSGIHAIVQRLFNIAYEPELVYIHFVLENVHKSFIGRIQAIEQIKDHSVPLYEKHFLRLIELVKELKGKIEEKEDLSDTLKKLVIVSYSLTGNGFYLMQKGLLKI